MEYNKNKKFLKNLMPKRYENSNKGTFGHVLNIASSKYYIGAGFFSSISPLIVGAGRSTLATTASAISKIGALSPDIIYLPLEESKNGTIGINATKKIAETISNYDVISIGCGLSTDKETTEFFKTVLPIIKDIQKPFIVDADGLNILATMENKKLNENAIITPHPLELSRLLTISVEQILSKPEFWVEKTAEKFDCTVVLKLHETLVCSDKLKLYRNTTGNTALSHGGSGDVLCGMISGFLAQGLNPFEASCLATYLHGKAGEYASKDLTEYSVTTSKLLDYIPKAIKHLL
ncbi:NAD(P)H-hydrate dehydratase [bacterium]|nr:NAD(P)H-hydrate dehydratase [bacterium]